LRKEGCFSTIRSAQKSDCLHDRQVQKVAFFHLFLKGRLSQTGGEKNAVTPEQTAGLNEAR
jgi:hypothetical protein